MTRNITSLLILIFLGLIAYFVFRGTPNEERQKLARVLKPVPAERIDRIEILRHDGSGSRLREEVIVLEKAGGIWRLFAPVQYPADVKLIEPMLQVLGNLKVVDTISTQEKKHNVLQVDSDFGIVVSVFGRNVKLAEMIIGISDKNMTYVRIPGETDVMRTVGMYRRTFDKSSTGLRDKTVTRFDRDSVTRVKYTGKKGTVEMARPGSGKSAEFTPVGMEIKNFDVQRALGNATALTNLVTRDFADDPVSPEVSGLDETATTVEFDASLDGQSGTFYVRLGNSDEKKRTTYVKTSLSDQVYLVASHIAMRFHVGPDDFARTDAQLTQAREREVVPHVH